MSAARVLPALKRRWSPTATDNIVTGVSVGDRPPHGAGDEDEHEEHNLPHLNGGDSSSSSTPNPADSRSSLHPAHPQKKSPALAPTPENEDVAQGFHAEQENAEIEEMAKAIVEYDLCVGRPAVVVGPWVGVICEPEWI